MSGFDSDQPRVGLDAPAELRAGVYSNVVLLGYSMTEFTLDFAVYAEPEASTPDVEGTQVDARLVARVQLPPTLVFDLLTAINGILTRYESDWGEVRKPQRRQEETGEED